MTTVEHELRALEAVSDRLTPDVVTAFARALRRVKDVDIPRRAVEALAQGDVVRAIDAVLHLPEMAAVRRMMQEATATAFVRAGVSEARLVVGPGLLRTPFTTGDPDTIEQLVGVVRGMEKRVPFHTPLDMTGFRAALEANLKAGLNPRQAIEAARPFIPLTAADHAFVMHYELRLRSGQLTDAMRSVWRDPKFDRTLDVLRAAGAPVPEQTIARARATYLDNLTAARAETWARTAALNASREAKFAAYAQSAKAAGIPLSRLAKQWLTTIDGRQREEHAAMHLQWARFTGTWPVDGGVKVPGENAWNCRCGFRVRVLPPGMRLRALA